MTRPTSERIPGREHYSIEYLRDGRVFSYAHQLDSVLSFHPETVLEIGPGGGMVTAALRTAGIKVTTIDLQSDLKPDVIASVTNLPFGNARFNMAICCQVLEHLPFDQFGRAVAELRRIAGTGLVLSLPDVSRNYYVEFRLPKIGERRFECSSPTFSPEAVPTRILDSMGHHWEIGYRGYPLSRIKESIRQSGWTIDKTWRVPEKPWHRFFSCRPF